MSFYYPKLDETTVKNLRVVKQLMVAHPGYFLEAPYSKDVEETLTEWFIEKKSSLSKPVAAESGEEKDPWDMLYSESKTLFENLKTVEFSKLGETAEMMSYFRTATSLLEKLVSLQERALGLKEIGDFHRAVMDIMENVLTPTQRTTVMDQLTSLTSIKNA